MGLKQVNNVIQGMSEMRTAYGEGDGKARDGNKSKAREEKERGAREESRNKKEID